MRKILAALAGLFFSATTLLAVPHQPEIVFLDLSTGYRQDDLKWNAGATLLDNIPGVPAGLEFISKLKWSDMQIYQVQGTARYVNCYRIYFRAQGSYGRVWHGHHTDRDFLKFTGQKGNEHEVEFLGSRASSNQGEVFDLLGGIGYFFRFSGDRVTLAPIAGYSHHEQHFQMEHLEIVVNDIDFFIGPVPGLHSSYETRWYGPWAGMDFTFKMTCTWELYGGAEFHWIRFRGKGHWNLRTDFVKDFRQRSGGWGQVYYVGLNYQFSPLWKVGVLYNYQTWHTRTGQLRQFFTEGSARLSLHPVRWITQSVMANLEYMF